MLLCVVWESESVSERPSGDKQTQYSVWPWHNTGWVDGLTRQKMAYNNKLYSWFYDCSTSIHIVVGVLESKGRGSWFEANIVVEQDA